MIKNVFKGVIPTGWQNKNHLLYLLTLRWSVILASTIIYFATTHEAAMIVSPSIMFIFIVSVNALITTFIIKNLKDTEKIALWILILDILQGTLAVSITGGYSSFFFVLYLLPFFETGIFFTWQKAARWIVSIDGIQIGATIIGRAVSETIISTNELVSRFVILLIVGLVAILLGGILRREELSREKASSSAKNLKKLNEIFVKLESCGFNRKRIVNVLMGNVSYIGKFLYSFIIFRIDSELDTWEVKATNNPELFPVGKVLKNLSNYTYKSLVVRKYASDPNINADFFEKGAKEVIGVNLSDYEDVKGLLIIGKVPDEISIPEEDYFLKALALEIQLVLHNTYLFEEKQKQIKLLDEYKEMQSTFFSAAAHEIKTPIAILQSLRSTLEFIINNPTPTQSEILDTMELNINRLNNLTTEILETTRLEGSDLVIHKKKTDIIKIIEGRLESIFPLAAKKSQKIIFKISNCQDSTNFPFVFGDRKRISEIISNLLSNALKFSPFGSIIILTAENSDRNIVICIYDRGKSISPKEKQKIFEKYYTSPTDKALAGFGLGLFISKKLVELHEGNIWIEDRLHRKGFCFSVPIYNEELSYEP